MKIYKSIPLEGDRLSTEMLEHLDLGESLTVYCETIMERDNSRQCAYYTRKNCPRPDGRTYKIEVSNVKQTVTVSVEPKLDSVGKETTL